jgi:hypothetical protein
MSSVDPKSRSSSGNPWRLSVLAVLPVAKTSWSFVALSSKSGKLVILPRACPSTTAFMFMGGGRLLLRPLKLTICDPDVLDDVGVEGGGDVGGNPMPENICRGGGNNEGESLGPEGY